MLSLELLKENGILSGIAFGWIVHRLDIQSGYLFFAILILLYFPSVWMLDTVRKRMRPDPTNSSTREQTVDAQAQMRYIDIVESRSNSKTLR
ncbi:hypothetical protein A2304_05420 [Candidatus Uhrbacteria bacterium RIFOXYB2_FULL_57_15]|uniref:Uncharacterized protein n=1 Tax=Candidatus Uhrbacteria bacterium RIFOXYB2_FULL_57_15 TaxID=1802422 RepID=A0A1F7W567_9BACT|nr:MAG: hypothetical protein A2304_05420 [Candidatus Uhrbacteria bacterium RIFOXYB2_FULL_57_15]OGM00646.1 MAG: hypothetical protein A2501_04095 [Candidatus Uhrbacteria bacterium RIFOXYC12_FULL_57_11]